MRLGGHVYNFENNSESYLNECIKHGFTAIYYPKFTLDMNDAELESFKHKVKEKGLILAEVGGWSNPFTPDPKQAKAFKEKSESRLLLAEKLEALTCVNVTGSKSTTLFSPDNFTEEFKEESATYFRNLIDKYQIKKTKMSFEVYPLGFLDTVDACIEFNKMVNRPKQTAYHVDFTNLIGTPRAFVNYKEIFKDAIDRLGKDIVTIHFKDLVINDNAMNTEITEVPVGTGMLDIGFMLQLCQSLGDDTCVMLEHYSSQEEYDLAAHNIREIASKIGVNIK